ncbi:MAG: hypothetical protein HYY24_28780 [Verrucomicrobia bacterium]|nr:hypothetical protein [Verrucomicrobiota bacterium]
MYWNSSMDDGKGQSLVFTFVEELRKDGDYIGPEPDFLKWMEDSLFVDVAISGDEAAYDKLSAEEREAWRLYCNALEATRELLDLYKTDLELFQKVAGQMMFLPCFLSWHPDTQRFNRHLLASSRHARHRVREQPALMPSRNEEGCFRAHACFQQQKRYRQGR